MRKSRQVSLTLLGAVVLLATGCHDTPESRNCVDAQGHVVPETNCQVSHPGAPAHYVYGGRSGGHIGDQVVGGSATPSEEGVSRGGFGSRGGGEAGEGGGE